MIQRMTKLVCADNTGAKVVMCIGRLGKARFAKVGSVISTTVKSAAVGSKCQVGEVHRALVIRQKKEYRREDGRHIRFGDNAVIMLGPDFRPLGSRINGPVPLELRKTQHIKVMSLAKTVV